MITFRREQYVISYYVNDKCFVAFSYMNLLLIMYLNIKGRDCYICLSKYNQTIFKKEKSDGTIKVKCFDDTLLSGVLL
jgi:hypothetical protein